MSSVVHLDPADPHHAALIARRHALDIDRKDEIWKGVYHVNPAPRRRHGRVLSQLQAEMIGLLVDSELEVVAEVNIGAPDDYRVPDAAILPPGPSDDVYLPTAALVVEVLSPGDDTFAKLPHFAAHGVGEVVIVHPVARRIDIHQLIRGRYVSTDRSEVLGVSPTELAARIRWPD